MTDCVAKLARVKLARSSGRGAGGGAAIIRELVFKLARYLEAKRGGGFAITASSGTTRARAGPARWSAPRAMVGVRKQKSHASLRANDEAKRKARRDLSAEAIQFLPRPDAMDSCDRNRHHMKCGFRRAFKAGATRLAFLLYAPLVHFRCSELRRDRHQASARWLTIARRRRAAQRETI